MRGLIDLHSHWVAGIDDGARTFEDSVRLLQALREVGFDTVCATPHMRPGMFDNTRADLERAHAATVSAVAAAPGLPALLLSSEHFFDDVVFGRLLRGEALPYPGGAAALIEFSPRALPAYLAMRLSDMRRAGLRPVIAHPERYEPVWRDADVLEPLLDGGALLLLDVAALAGKYGRQPKRSAFELLEAGFYYAACSDAHAARDVTDVQKGIAALEDAIGAEEAAFLLRDGPRSILEGAIQDE